jgi:DNA topoisomerase-6 subunit B
LIITVYNFFLSIIDKKRLNQIRYKYILYLKSLKPAATSILKSDQQSQSQSQKVEKYKIIYNKKAESEFFVDNSALAGFTGERILYMAVRELIENALDSCETFSILPSIKISLKTFDQTNDLWMLSCEDNGTGISSDKLPIAVCSFLTSAKYMEKQQRGLFGVGLKMVAAFTTKDTDFPIKVWNKSIEEYDEYYFELRTDIGTNKPIVLKKSVNKYESLIKDTSGFKIQVILRARLVPITKNKIYDYVTQTSIVNPYALITFETDDGIFTFDRRTSIMPAAAKEILPHPSDMDLQTLKKAISKFAGQKITLPKILCSSFQKFSYDKAKEIISSAHLDLDLKNSSVDFNEHDLIKIVNICKKTKFQNPNTDHLSPIGQEILTIGMMSEYTIVSNKNTEGGTSENNSNSNIVMTEHIKKTNNENDEVGDNNNNNKSISKNQSNNYVSTSKSNFSVKVLQPVLSAYTSRTGIINNRPTIIETGLAYGGDINSFKLYRFANKIPLLYDEGSDVAREVVSEVEINKMGITKKQAKEQFSTTNKESKRDRVIEVLPIHIFFHICSTKIPYKTAGKESIASEGELKSYMKSCLSELYRKLSTQIRKELKMKEAENKLKLYKHYLPFIVDAITESLGVKNSKLNESFSILIEKHLTKKSNVNGVGNDEESDIVTSTDTNSTIHAPVTDDSSSSGPTPPPPNSIQSSNSKFLKSQKKDNSTDLKSFKIDIENGKKMNQKKNTLTNHDQRTKRGGLITTTSDTSFTISDDSNIKGNSNLMYKNKNSKGSKPPVLNNNNNSKYENRKTPKKILSNAYSKKKINKKLGSADFHSTLDSFQQRRVNKGKIK